ncbi:MAG: hypothetical protein HY645_01240 [Acidobacteria bacterium]|nr:hypothetical protein [Acidobacteriota bacterium]
MFLPMARIQIIGTRRCRDRVIQVLQAIGSVQIDEWTVHKPAIHPSSEPPVSLRDQLAYQLTRIEALLSALPDVPGVAMGDYDSYCERPPDWIAQQAQADVETVAAQAQEITKLREQLQGRLQSLPRYKATFEQLVPLIPPFLNLEHYALAAVWLTATHETALALIRGQLEQLTSGACEIITRHVDPETVAALLIFPKSHAAAVNQLLGQENIPQIRLPAELSTEPFANALQRIHEQLQSIPTQLVQLEHRENDLSLRWRSRLQTWKDVITDHLNQIDLGSQLGQSEYSFRAKGWIPANRLQQLQSELRARVGEEVLVEVLPTLGEEKKEAPILFQHSPWVKSFQPLVKLLGLPKYGSLDPTPLMALFFPLFFGMILGDVGHGTVLLAAALWIRRRYAGHSAVRSLAGVVIAGSLWGVLFGFLYGEFWGDLGHRLGMRPLLLERGKEIRALFLLTVGIGAGHVCLGLGLGVWNAVRTRARHLLLEKAATLISLTALFVLLAILARWLPKSLLTPAWILLLIGLVILIYSLGKVGVLLGPLELLGALGNILSYLRIAAIGLASVYLGHVANQLAGFAGNIVVGLLVATLFHALNVTLGAFTPAIQSLRLQYVEFFSKFYESGGRPFLPFCRSRERSSHTIIKGEK